MTLRRVRVEPGRSIATSACAQATQAMWWLSGLRVRSTVSSVWCQSATMSRALASRVLLLCMTPLGSPVVPEVKAM